MPKLRPKPDPNVPLDLTGVSFVMLGGNPPQDEITVNRMLDLLHMTDPDLSVSGPDVLTTGAAILRVINMLLEGQRNGFVIRTLGPKATDSVH